jgi:ketosteroid isomerase-like protein
MSQENVSLASETFDAWNRGDYEAWIDVFDSECEFWPLRAQLEGRPYRGHDGLRLFIADFNEEWEHVRFVLTEIHDAGDRLAAVARIEARGRASGAQIQIPIGMVATVRAGKFAEVRMYSDAADALEAAGLRE